MNMLISLIVIVYLVGVGVALSPVIEDKWSTSSAQDLTRSVGEALPGALAWPVHLYHRVMDRR